MMMSDDPFCINCNEKVPNMFKTLWTLKNLDKIQAGAQYNKFIVPSSFYLTSTMYARPGQTWEYDPSGEMAFYVPTLPKP